MRNLLLIALGILASSTVFATTPVVRCEFQPAWGNTVKTFDVEGTFRGSDIASGVSYVNMLNQSDWNSVGVIVTFLRTDNPNSEAPTSFELVVTDTGATGSDLKEIAKQTINLPAGYPISAHVEGISRQGIKLSASCKSF